MSRERPTKTTFNILFVCTGNTCRSPLAEAAARRALAQRGWRHVCVASAGAAAEPGYAASPHAITVAQRHGLDLEPHRSRPLTPELVEWADLVLTMGSAHRYAVARLGGEEKAALLSDFAAGDEGAGHAVPDPYGGEEERYEQTLAELERLVDAALDRLSPILHP